MFDLWKSKIIIILLHLILTAILTCNWIYGRGSQVSNSSSSSNYGSDIQPSARTLRLGIVLIRALARFKPMIPVCKPP